MIKKHNTIGKGSKHRAINGGTDEYFTKPEIASHFVNFLLEKIDNNYSVIIEPSAGSGAFVDAIKSHGHDIIAYDIHSKRDDIKQMNWFNVDVPKDCLVLGNPPFGTNASLAVKFIKHATQYNSASYIAFILPRTFGKISFQNKIPQTYHLIYTEDCPKNSFLLDNKEYNVPCVFQIWKREKTTREQKKIIIKNDYVDFVHKKDAEFIIVRAGGKAGTVINIEDSTYRDAGIIYCREKIVGVKDVLTDMDFSNIIDKTAGVRSLSKREIVEKLNEYYKNKKVNIKLIDNEFIEF